ncbi:GNAT family acetyltransferase [Rhizoctonia solani]|uniref:GNAT family acetyltransferase n=1 Tax=Rhizoctonia solani TaxID=456999 RepID=A0A8H8NXF2_9AGAM|nr:GNAT family acetyltransferase [Rhizoctonia solani]QRW20658.1 GNAT family acetyltransferase [Rhizoctonia solani]
MGDKSRLGLLVLLSGSIVTRSHTNLTRTAHPGRAISILTSTLPDFFKLGLVTRFDASVSSSPFAFVEAVQPSPDLIYARHIRFRYAPPGNEGVMPKVLQIEGLPLYFASAAIVRTSLNALYSDMHVALSSVEVSTLGVREREIKIGLIVSGSSRVGGGNAEWDIFNAAVIMPYTVRPVTPADRPVLSRICLLTGDAGQSAEGEYHYSELLGLVYAEPYAVVEPHFGFVLVDNVSGDVVGYVIGTTDTRAFERNIENDWYKGLRGKYTKDPYPQGSTSSDKHMINLIHNPDTAPDEIIAVSQAHIHIDLLPAAQGQGWGTKLMGKAVEYLKSQGNDSLFVGIDSRNARARSFYLAIGFEGVKTAHGEYFRLGFDQWRY